MIAAEISKQLVFFLQTSVHRISHNRLLNISLDLLQVPRCAAEIPKLQLFLQLFQSTNQFLFNFLLCCWSFVYVCLPSFFACQNHPEVLKKDERVTTWGVAPMPLPCFGQRLKEACSNFVPFLYWLQNQENTKYKKDETSANVTILMLFFRFILFFYFMYEIPLK